ncbi:MAG: hypothetical protein AABM66_04565 [Actinomycetota bacterium]
MGRDRELVGWIARMGAVGIGHVQARFGICRSVSYEVVARLVEASLIERIATLPGDPTLLCATPQGIIYARLGLPPARVTPGAVDHWLACADTALWAERRWAADSLMSERELRFAELDASKPIASAIVGELPDGRPRLHRPDLVVHHEGLTMAIEVELTPKAPRRLLTIVRAWRRARQVDQVLYLCPPGPTQRAVERAVESAYAQERVIVRELGSLR